MLTRLTHAAIAFAITVVVYQAYVLLAAPLIEPPAVLQVSGAEDQQGTLQATHKYRELLAAYFPPGHWTLTQPPITAENGQAMIVLDEFNPRDDGQVRVKKCAILFFPQGRVSGDPPPSDAVVLEAPQGAVLQMDQSLKGGMGNFGKLQWGKLTGQITIRSNMRDPGPHDDLLLTTSNLEIQEEIIYTMDRVDVQLGAHRGRGRQLEIRLDTTGRSRSEVQGTNLGRIRSLEIFKEVQAELSPGQVNLGPSPLPTGDTTNAPPVQITCDGRFRFDFASQVASFDDHVLLRQIHPQGPLDELRCKRLSVYFTRAVNPEGKRSAGMTVGMIEATGDSTSPVVLHAQSQQATARCERMRIELELQQITFDRGPDVMLTLQGNEIHAKQIQYQAPPKDSGQRVGNLLAAGSGWLRAYTSKGTSGKKDTKPFEARWTENMRLRRINGQPVLSLNGRPRLDMVGMGQLWADHLDLYLRESAADGSEAELLPGDIVPERLVAGGQIAIDSAQLHGKVKQLEVRFDYVPSSLQLSSPQGNNPRRGKSRLGSRGGAIKRAYDIVGETLQMLITVRHNKPEVTSIDVDGQVVFNESSEASSPAQGSTKEPLRVVADHLRIENADSPEAEISLSGKPATITADGMVIRTENLQINRGTSRAWVDAPGEIEMLVDRDLSGKQLAAPQPMTIRWNRSMELDQDRITFNGNVQVRTAEGTLDTQQMVVRLTAPVQFDGAASQRRIEIAQLECHGRTNAIFSQRDALGLSSVQTMQLEESLFANLQTGKIRSEGPGQMESVHLSTATNPIGDFANNNRPQRGPRRLASAGRQPPPAQRLRFLGIQFNRGIQGNLQSRQIRVLGDVDAVYGPVDAWEQRLALTKRGMPGPETIWISSQSLSVAESPLARLNPNRHPNGHRSQSSSIGPLELLAEGNRSSPVTIEGPIGERGNFTTRSLRAKYDQSKKTFILEGTYQQPAMITMQEYRGGPTSPTSARKITYYQETGNFDVVGLVSGQLRQLAPAGER
ncbi:MAG: hypothetical protein GXP24_03140 [Planctomycetes bacterium]|nr:hypothetical protein [Planctomycetota bacterium]